MNTEPGWTRLPAAAQAADAEQYGVLLRLARTAAGLTLEGRWSPGRILRVHPVTDGVRQAAAD